MIKMSCSLTVGEHILPLYLKQFQQAYPMIQLDVTIANSKQIVTQIRNHQLDLGLIETPIEDATIKSEPFLQDELFVVAPPNYFGEGVEEITVDQLCASPIIFRDQKSTRLNSTHVAISYAVFCLEKKVIELILNGPQ